MAEFKISRIRYTWKGNWAAATAYIKDDIVKYGGSTWICIRQHTAAAFATDQTYLASPTASAASPAWLKMTEGYAFRGSWTASTLYNPGDISLYGGVLYLCATSHTSAATFVQNYDKWAEYVSLYNWTGDWQPTTRYGIGDLAKYNGIVYRCTSEHLSQPTADGIEVGNDDSTQDSTLDVWEVVNEGIEYVGDWQPNTRYRLNDLIKYGGTILRCTVGHTSTSVIDNEKVTVEFPGFKYYNEWLASVQYSIGDIVKYGGHLYRSNTNHSGIWPSYSSYPAPYDTNWTLLQKGVNFRGDWAQTGQYRTGDVVRRGGYLYVAITDTVNDQSTLDYLDTSNWEIVVSGDDWKNSWIIPVEYQVGDLVLFSGSTWRCNTAHTSSEDNYPATDSGSGYFYWDLLLLSGTNVGMTNRGDLLTYGLSRSLAGDGSTFNETRVPLGTSEELLAVNSDGDEYYKVWGNIDKVRYVSSDDAVALDDITDPDRGINPFKPWRTIRYACEQLEAAGSSSELTTIKVSTGYYEEVLPIIIPVNVSIVGEELRSVTVVANPPIAALATDYTYTLLGLDRINDIIENVIAGNPVTKTLLNPFSQNIMTTAGSQEAANDIQDLISDITNYINFYIPGTGILPEIVGTATSNQDAGYVAARECLEANRDFLANEAIYYVREQEPTYPFDNAKCLRDMNRYIDAWIYDLEYTGNYKSTFAARYYVNAVLGSADEDMFYLRNATGIKNMTLKGLEGGLNPPLVNELYRRPTGGAYCSLDPGWGPTDERTWITSRSPYIQNCTTFGYGAIGQKIDGALHAGGNKSMVSNDFTQVISDGVGAWVLNNGRAELVSVFTYYSQIGMFAEDGGVIRATNGNSSYGKYGALADGNDPSETPRYATVNTRTTDARVSSAFAGEASNNIFILEFSHAGENYTTADYTFVGSGTQATVQQREFRDNGIFEMMIKNNPNSPGGTPGGGGYSEIGNNAQAGSIYTLTIASNNANTEAELLGLRIIITSGDGTGQYGYVQAYDEFNKIVTVYRESDDQPGWDHLVPGWPIQTTYTTNVVYRFEPRIKFAEPDYSVTDVDLSVSTSWTNIAYSETYEVYSDLTGTAGTGTTIEVIPYAAVWDVVKNGRNYEVTLAAAGAGYADEQTITIDGEDVGGISGENDITITVKSVSDDSTNSIVSFEYSGIAQSGRFVVTPSTGTSSVYSSDGENWDTAPMPSSGDWRALCGSEQKFVAIKYASNEAAYSQDGINWTTTTMPASRLWSNVVCGKTNGNGTLYVAVAENLNSAAYSTNGITWTSSTLPTVGDSTLNTWIDVAYGNGIFVAIANSGNVAAVGTWNGTTLSWIGTVMDVIADSTNKDWVSVAFGNGRFVAVSATGDVSYSFNGTQWYAGQYGMATQDGSTIMNWKQIRYGQGVFFALCDTSGVAVIGGDGTDGTSAFCATSPDGIVWTGRSLSESQTWKAVAFGNPDISLGDSSASNSRPMFVAVAQDVTNIASRVFTGTRALGRTVIQAGRMTAVKIWEPGSGYQSTPTYTITDPNNTSEAYLNLRIGDGVLAQPDWLNRGINYKTSTTDVTVTGDGYADTIPGGAFVTLSGLSVLPGPGTQFRFRGENDFYTVATIEVESSEAGEGTVTATFRVSPPFDYDYYLEHGSDVEIRERYSQVRITGHDFLDVGTGNIEDTIYPQLYTNATAYQTAPEDEIVELNGGRVFYTSTDQSGNFRTGELFAVEQATGIVTISADFFDLQGLTELALGGVRLGGSGAVIREFSTDPLFTADSNNVIPTQKAIKAYLANRLNVGGSDLLTASFIAGTIRVGPDYIGNTAGLKILIPVIADFSGDVHISGSMLAQTYYISSFSKDYP